MNDFSPYMAALVVLAALWTIPWKGWALWKAARAGSKPWFIVLLLINTVGLLEILYIYVFSKRTSPPPAQKPT